MARYYQLTPLTIDDLIANKQRMVRHHKQKVIEEQEMLDMLLAEKAALEMADEIVEVDDDST